MTDTAIENAARVRDECRAKIREALKLVDELKVKAERAERFISDWEEFSGQSAPTPELEDDGAAIPREVLERRSEAAARNPKKEDVAEFAVKVIREAGKPLTRSELHKALSDQGIVIYGTNPPVVLQTMLWRMNKVVTHIKGYGYWPADTAYPLGKYDPDDDIDLSAELGDEARALP